MTVHPFDWRDLIPLYHYRNQSVFLDSALVLTRGAWLVPGALLSYLAPALGVFTWASDGRVKASPIIGQMMHFQGAQFARLTFLTPDEALDSSDLYDLLDAMVALSRARGALRLLAEVEETTQAFEMLRRASFAIYTRQRIWQLTSQVNATGRRSCWRVATDRDIIAIRSLYSNLVPGLVQQAEPFMAQRPEGFVYCQDADVLAYVELKYGQRGIWVQPFVHPDAREVSDRLAELLDDLPYRHSRPVYLCVRSYQSWLEPAIEGLGAEAGARQAVMVKHLAAAQKANVAFARPAMETGQIEISTPVSNLENK